MTHAARNLCFLLSERLCGLTTVHDSDLSEFRSEGISYSFLWMNCGGRGGPTDSVSMGLSKGFVTL